MKISLFVIVFGLSLSIPGGGEAAFGGHDLFTSLSQLHSLWQNEQAFVNKMEEAATSMEAMLTAMRR